MNIFRNSIFVLSVVTLVGCAVSQPFSGPTPERVIQVPGIDAQTLYQSSRQWIAENFRSAKAVIQYEDKDTQTVIGNGTSQYCYDFGALKKSQGICLASPITASYTLKVEAKDGRMRISVPNAGLVFPAGQYGPIREVPADANQYPIIADEVLQFGDSIANYATANRNKSDF